MDVIVVLILTFVCLPVIFCTLFIVFLTRSIKRGKRIRELEKELNDLKSGNQVNPNVYNPYQMPQQGMMQGWTQPPVYVQLPEIQPQGYVPPRQAEPASAGGYMPQAVQGPQFGNAMSGQSAASVPAPAPAPASTPAPAPQQAAAFQAPTPSWALSPAQAQAQAQARAAQANAVKSEPEPRKKVFSSINITFGIGVLLLTIVGATFMTVSWSWMDDALRAVSLVAIVLIAYGLSFVAGKLLKLQQTGFAFYTLASMLGPIVVLGMGAFELLGSAFSFKNGTGWMVATLSAAVLLVSSVGGRLIFREKIQSGVYKCTFYIALTWLVVFLSAQIGQHSEVTNEWNMICLGLATLALVFRIISITKLFEGEKFFTVYSEIITYVPVAFLTIGLFNSDGAVFGATIVEMAALLLYAKFAEGRNWFKYLTPLAGLSVVLSWIGFGDVEETYVISSVIIVIIVLVYVIHKMLRIATVLSDILLPVSLCAITMLSSYEDVPLIGAAASFLALGIIIFRMVIEPVLSGNGSVPEGVFNENLPVPVQVIMSVLGTSMYYTGMTAIYLSAEEAINGSFYFTLSALIPAAAAIAVRFFRNDDYRIKTAGISLSVMAVTAGLFSCFRFGVVTVADSPFCQEIHACAWILTLAVIVLAMNFIAGPVRERKLSYGAMFCIPLILNSLSIGVLLTIAAEEINLTDAEMNRALQITSLSFLIHNAAAVAVTFFAKKAQNKVLSGYGAGLKYYFNAYSGLWFLFTWLTFHSSWEMMIIAVVFTAVLYLLDSGFFAVLPVIAAECSVICLLDDLENGDLRNILFIAISLAVALAGRLIFRKNVFTKNRIDYLSLLAPLIMFGLTRGDYVPMVVLLALSLIIMNFAGRVNVPVRLVVSVFAILVSVAVICQPFFDIPDLIVLETDIAILLVTVFMICRLIRPFSAKVMKYVWFTGVALSLIAEGVSAAVTGEGLDLIIVGSASIGIFIYAFIRRNRLWFILGIASILSVAVYLSVAFWSSLVWLVFLLIAGVVLVAMAAVNEWGKRHSKDGKKRRFFEEWTW